jgi:hypothetical protein
MALTLLSLTLVQPTAITPTGAAQFSVDGPPGSYTIAIPGLTTAPEPMTTQAVGYLYYRASIPPGSYVATFSNGTDTLTIPFAIIAPPTVDSQPASVTAAHLPMLATLRADPTGTPLAPAVLLAVVEVFKGGAWVSAGKIREVCGALGTARVDVSEYVKTQFAETPPDESGGADPALGIRWRVRYGRATDFDGTPGDEAGTYGGLAVNAAEVVNPGLAPYPLALGPASPYTAVPTGAARFVTTVNAAADAVVNLSTIPVDASRCAARQFVWLHPSGKWAWGFFSGRHDHGDETSDGLVVRRANGVRKYVSRGDVGEVLNVYSDKIENFATYNYLRSVRTSVQAYERLASGLYVPVLVEAGSYPGYKETDKLFEVNFTVRYPLQVRQTQ